MALSNPRGLFGAHSVVFYDRTTGLPIVGAKVIGEFNADFKAEIEDLEGGSNMFPWDGEIKKISSEISFQGKEYSGTLMNLLLGGTLTSAVADATGNVTTLTNVKGTTCMKATTGIASVTALSGSEGDMKSGKYIIKVISATTVDIYCLTDVDFRQGTAGLVLDDTWKITAAALTVPGTGATISVTGYGIKLTGGSGSIAMTIGDTAEFYVRKVNAGGSVEVIFGQTGSVFQEFGLVVAGQRRADGSINCIEFYRVKGAGMPISLKEKSWSEFSASLKAYYDSGRNAVGKVWSIYGAA